MYVLIELYHISMAVPAGIAAFTEDGWEASIGCAPLPSIPTPINTPLIGVWVTVNIKF
jgi:hypothetical protein